MATTLAVPPAVAAIAPVGWRAFIAAQAPSVPPPGGLEQVAGLLLARSAPGDTDVQRSLLTRWGLDELDATTRDRCATRTNQAYTRLRALAAATGVPDVLRAALEIAVITPARDLPGTLRHHGLGDGRGGALLVDGLRQAYDLTDPSTAAWQALGESERTAWEALLHGLSRRGVAAVPPALLPSSTVLAWYLRRRHAALAGPHMVALTDHSRLSRLLRRQLALGRCLTVSELQTGVRRATGAEPPPTEALQAWLLEQDDVKVHADRARAGAATAAGWGTREDRLLLSCLGDRQAMTRTELVACGVAAGRTRGAMGVVLARSPILRRGQRGTYRLPPAEPGPA